MSNPEIIQKKFSNRKNDPNQRGSAIVIAIFILILLSAFVALALSRTATEATAVGNETSEARTLYAAQGSLELMTRNFNKVFETKLSPADTDFNSVRTPAQKEMNFNAYTFNREVLQTSNSTYATINEGAFAGLYATRDSWRLRTTATDPAGVQVQLTRDILNNRIPIFQFGIFYNDDMELHPGANFAFGGRVHSNGSMFLMTSSRIYFTSRVSAVGEIIADVNRNGKAYNAGWGENVFIKNGNSDVQLKHDYGSAVTTPANGVALFRDSTKSDYNPDMPTVYKNADWETRQGDFGGNLLARQKTLDLPLKISSTNAGAALDYIELIKRGKNEGDLYKSGGTSTSPVISPVPANKADSAVTASERYYNKTGLRVSIASSKAKLPGCATDTGAAVSKFCGVRLDGASAKPNSPSDAWGDSDANGSRGYKPLPMTDGYQATRLNGERFRTSAGEVWIKVEMVSKDATTNNIDAVDVTEDILSLGVTEEAPASFGLSGYGNSDSRSILKLQRFAIKDTEIAAADTPYMTSLKVSGTDYNIIKVGQRKTTYVLGSPISTGTWTPSTFTYDNPVSNDSANHYQSIPSIPDPLGLTGNEYRIVPFPIEIFDPREGIYYFDNNSVFNPSGKYGANVPWAGVMSMVDIDVDHLRRFLDGEFNSAMPTNTAFYNSQTPKKTLQSSTVPQNNGWVVYTSDRRGDYDFDGEYDMEDVFGQNDGIKQTGEDVNKNGILDLNYTNEAVKYVADGLFASASSPGSWVPVGYAATVDHPFYRRGFRLINGEKLPGKFDAANPDNTKGFTFASENGVYVQGNYNATGIRAGSTGSPTPFEDYLPQGAITVNGVPKGTADGEFHIPASIAGDAITILSNSWNDGKSFRYPYSSGSRKASVTFTRFAMIAGDPLSSLVVAGEANQGGSDARLSGGVHNFKRYIEDWGGVNLNYCGSLINLYNSRNNNGTQKATGVYAAPTRNWVFDSTFLDPKRLPPGTPYFQFVQTTGFQRTND